MHGRRETVSIDWCVLPRSAISSRAVISASAGWRSKRRRFLSWLGRFCMVQPGNYVSDRGQSRLKARLGLDMLLYVVCCVFAIQWNAISRTPAGLTLDLLYDSSMIRRDRGRGSSRKRRQMLQVYFQVLGPLEKPQSTSVVPTSTFEVL